MLHLHSRIIWEKKQKTKQVLNSVGMNIGNQCQEEHFYPRNSSRTIPPLENTDHHLEYMAVFNQGLAQNKWLLSLS